ncbi:MAG: GNAT family N-acetyltransferase [Flavobacteriales bacterium]
MVRWKFSSFERLTKKELHQIFILRQRVFIVEQNCPYLDADTKDLDSFHLMGFDKANNLIAYLRLVKAGISYKEPSFGRIVVAPENRQIGLGGLLMQEGIRRSINLLGSATNRISAQSHLVPFYEKFGFVSTNKEYLEDNIPHTEMIKQ